MQNKIRIKIRVHGSDVTLTIPLDGTPVQFVTGGTTEEGYSYTSYTYRAGWGELNLEISTVAQDCDGRYENWQDLTTPLIQGPRISVPVNEWGYPEFAPADQGQRDYTAEYAGY